MLSTAAPTLPKTAPQRDLGWLAWPTLLLFAGALVRFLAYAGRHADLGFPAFAHAMCVWDCTWYGDIALHGYQAYPENLNFGGPAGISNWAFFPLYPMLIAAIRWLVPLDPAVLGAIVSPLLTYAATLAARPLFGGDDRAHRLFAALLLVGPFSFYFATLYSESLFLLLTVLAFVALERRTFIAAGFWGALLSATRTVGVLFVFALAFAALRELRRDGWRTLPRRPDLILALLLVPLGLFGFMIWLYGATGDALAFFHIQRGWDRETVNPILAVWHALTGDQGKVRNAFLLGVASLVGLGLCGALAVRRDWPPAIFCALALLVPLTNGVESMLRFVAALAPLGMVLCQLLASRRWLYWLSLALFLALDFLWTADWLAQRGALM